MKALSLHTLFDSQTELLLLLVLIAFFLIGSLLTLVITLNKRQKKITLVKTKRAYESQIESYILRFLFENDEQAIADFIKNPNSKKTLFKKLTMKYCLIMHQNYTGTIQTSILEAATCPRRSADREARGWPARARPCRCARCGQAHRRTAPTPWTGAGCPSEE